MPREQRQKVNIDLATLSGECLASSNGFIISAEDTKSYKLLTLENQLECFLVSDAKLDNQAYCSLSVHVGSWQEQHSLCSTDTDDASRKTTMHGIAHLVEHLVLLSSESSFSNDSENASLKSSGSFGQWLSDHGGDFNAHTAAEETNYHFNVSTDALFDALHFFSACFKKSSLFPEEYDTKMIKEFVLKEMNAVDTEFSRTKENDVQRMWHVIKHLSHPNHPMNSFECGNMNSFQPNDQEDVQKVVSEADKFFRTFYSADIMKLVVFGSQSIEELQIAVTKTFSHIPNKHIIQKLFPNIVDEGLRLFQSEHDKVFRKDVFNKIIRITPCRNAKTLNIIFPTYPLFYNDPSTLNIGHNLIKDREFHTLDALRFVSSLIEFDGVGTLFHFLKSKHLINHISSNITSKFHEFSMFTITINCTDQGISSQENIEFIISSVFAFLKHYNDRNKLKQMKYFHDELRALSLIAYRFHPEVYPPSITTTIAQKLMVFHNQSSIALRLVENLGSGAKSELGRRYYENLISSSFTDPEFNLDAVCHLMECIADVNKCIVVSLHPSNDSFSSKQTIHHIEPIYNAEYTITSLDATLVAPEILEMVGLLADPPQNDFIPDQFDLFPFDMRIANNKNDNQSSLFFANYEEYISLKQENSSPEILLSAISRKSYFKPVATGSPWAKVDMFRPPLLIKLHDGPMRLWFKQDMTFLRPKTYVKFQLNTPYFAESYCKSQLLLTLFDVYVTDLKSSASKAGYNIGRSCDQHGLCFIFQGYTQKLGSLIENTLSSFIAFLSMIATEFQPGLFERLRENLRHSLDNSSKSSSLSLTQKAFHQLVEGGSDSKFDDLQFRMDELQDTTIDQVASFASGFRKIIASTVEKKGSLLVYGNANLSMAKDFSAIFRDGFKLTSQVTASSSRSKKDSLVSRELVPAQTKIIHFDLNKNESDLSSVILAFHIKCPNGSNKHKCFVEAEIFTALIQNSFFTQFRTKESLAYNCFSNTSQVNGQLYIKFCIESKERDSVFLQNRIECFLQDQLSLFLNNSFEIIERFDNVKVALINSLLQAPKSMDAEQGIWWTNITENKNVEFDTKFKMAHEAALVTLSDLNSFAKEFLASSGSQTRKLVVGIISRKHFEFPNVSDDKKFTSTLLTSRRDQDLDLIPGVQNIILVDDISIFKQANI